MLEQNDEMAQIEMESNNFLLNLSIMLVLAFTAGLTALIITTIIGMI